MAAPAREPSGPVARGEHRYRVPVSALAQDSLRRPLWHVIDGGADECRHRGRMEYVRLETLLDRFLEAEIEGRNALMLTQREASTLLAWSQLQVRVHEERGTEIPGAVTPLVARLEYMLGLRGSLPGQVQGASETTPRCE